MATTITGTTIDVNTAVLNRLSTDGTIVDLQKDGTSVGSIGSVAGVVSNIILDPRTSSNGGVGIQGSGTDTIIPVDGSGATANGTKNLGNASARWKDLYLSGGVYLGGTGAANKLDDYEEGTWTPSFGGSTSNPTVNFNVAGGTYVKVGSLVTIGVKTTTVSVSGGSGGLFLNGLPFTRSTDGNYGAVAALTQNFNALPSEPLRGYVVSDYVRFKYGNAVDVPTSVLRTSGDSNQIWMSFTYHTDS